MPRQRLHQKEAVGKLQVRLERAAKSVRVTSGKAGKEWRRVAYESPVDEEMELVNPDLEDWDTDSGTPSNGAQYVKDWAMVLDGKTDQELDYVLNVIEEMRPAGAVKADMDKAWEVFASVQCK